MDYKNNQKYCIRKETWKAKSKSKSKKYIWRRQIVKNINISAFEDLPRDILTYITHFLQIIDIINIPTLSKHLQDDFQKNYLILPHSELFLRFNYGRLILDNDFFFLEMEKTFKCCLDSTECSNNNCLKYKCLTDDKLLDEFIKIVSIMCNNLIKDKTFKENKFRILTRFLINLCSSCEKRFNRVLIISTIMEHTVRMTTFLENNPQMFLTIFHKCLEFSSGLEYDENQIGMNGLINLLENSISNEILEDKLYCEILSHIGEIYEIFPTKYLRIIVNFHLKIKQRMDKHTHISF